MGESGDSGMGSDPTWTSSWPVGCVAATRSQVACKGRAGGTGASWSASALAAAH